MSVTPKRKKGTRLKSKIFFIVVLASQALVAHVAPAQGTIYLSNLGETPVGSGAVGSDSWLAQPFVTGTNSTGYVLNSVQLLMNAATGSPSGFTASIYSFSGNGPGINLGSLSGSNPSAGGLFSFISSGVTLSRSTYYFVVVTATSPVAQGAYQWSAADSFGRFFVAPGDPWMIPDSFLTSADGSNWTAIPRMDIFQFAIDANANAVPEPGVSGFLLAGSLCFLWFRRKGKSARRSNPLTI